MAHTRAPRIGAAQNARRLARAFVLESALAGALAAATFATTSIASPVRVAQADSSSSEARRLLQEGKDAFAANRYEEAAKLFERAYAADEKLTLALYNRAFALRKAGKLDDARAAYLAYVARAPDDHDGLFGLAETERLLAHHADAERLFTEYLRRETRAEKAKYREYAEKKVAELRALGPSAKTTTGAPTTGAPTTGAPTTGAAADATALAAQADVEYRSSRFESAASLWERAYTAAPERHDFVYRRALALRKANDLAGAEAAYRAYATKVPDDLDGLFGLAETVRLAGKNDEARALFEQYVAKETRGDRAKYVSYANAQLAALTPAAPAASKADTGKAARLFEEGLAEHKKGAFVVAAEKFAAAHAADPARADALYRRGLSLRKANALDDARASYLAFLRAKPDDADGLYGLAETERLRADVPAARTHFQRYIEVETRPSEASYVERAKAYLKETAPTVEIVKKDVPTHRHVADGDLTSAAFANRVTANGLVTHGEEALRASDFAKADSHFALAVALDPENARAHLLRGRAREGLGLLDEARESFDAAIEKASDEQTKNEATAAKTTLGQARSTTSGAQTVSIERVARGNEFLRQAQAAHAQRDLKTALAAASEAVKANPELVDAHLLAGEIHLEQKSGVRALDAYQKALVVDGDLAAPLYGIGRAYELLGEVRAARHHYKLYVDSAGADVDAAKKKDAWLRLEGAR